MHTRGVKLIVASVALVGIGGVAVHFISAQGPPAVPPARPARSFFDARSSGRVLDRTDERESADRSRASIDERIQLLMARLAEESAKRQQLEDQLDNLTEQIAALRAHADLPGNGLHARHANADRAANQTPGPGDGAGNAEASGDTKSAMERALVAAGIDPSTAAELKRRRDELTMREMYLRDQATREEWLNSPRFTQEMEAINAQRTSIRDDIGDDAYDRYLFAQGEANRVRIEDVMVESAAAEAGLQAGDIVLRYGDTRIFGPEDLVNETRSGTSGESTQLQILRNGQLLQVNVPRGPLGLRIAATQAEPTS